MTLISFICLLALSSSAFGRSSYGSYSSQEPIRELTSQQRTLMPQSSMTNTIPTGYGQQINSYSPSESKSMMMMNSRTVLPVPEPIPVQQWANAEMQCRGQRPGTIIPLDNGRRWITCLEEEKAVEQSCPRNLFYNLESRRCERRAGALENPCISQPCLNNGQCLPIDSSSFECKCAAGFDGHFCELDARVCQTQQPCGQASGTRCQSFRSGAALQYVCIHQNELAYGFTGQQVQPSPCQNIDGTHPLLISDKGFLMCDGERMYVESCPGGTIWDDVNKACVWPDMQGFFGSSRPVEPVKDYSYSQPKPVATPSFTGPVVPSVRTIEPVSSYGQMPMQRSFEQSSLPVSQQQSYSSQMTLPKMTDLTIQSTLPKPMDMPIQQQTIPKTMDLPIQQTSSYGSQQMFQQPMQKTQEFVPVQRLPKQPEFRSFQQSSSY